MKNALKTLIVPLSALALLTACSGQTSDATAQTKTETTQAATPAKIENSIISAIPSGTYKSESGHAYIAFTYSHQGYSNPIVRWGKFDATLELDSENPTNSTLSVNVDPASVDTGVEKFDAHLKSADFFDISKYPNIAFTSSSLTQSTGDKGTLTGDLTMHGVTKPITLDVTLNKAGKSRGGSNMFGISAKGALKRSDFGIDKYTPMADDVNLMIEVEFVAD